MAFYIGQKVVCIRAPKCCCGLCDGHNPAVEGGVYTVHDVNTTRPNSTGLLFREIPVPRPHEDYIASNFRPLVERKTDISIFTAMLGPRQKETVDGR